MNRRAVITGHYLILFKSTPKGYVWNRAWPEPIDCGTDARAHVAKRLWESKGVIIAAAGLSIKPGKPRDERQMELSGREYG